MNKKKVIFGFVLIVLGLFIWLNSIDAIDISPGDVGSLMVPFGLIGLGVWMIARKRKTPEFTADPSYQYDFQKTQPSATPEQAESTDYSDISSGPTPPPPPPPGGPQAPPQSERTAERPGYSGSGKVKYDKFIGDMYIDCNNTDLQNMEVSVFISDLEIKLHGGRLAPGLNRLIISGFIGDVRILIPPDMAVFVQSSNFIGDSELMGQRFSGFGNTVSNQTANYATAQSKLYIASNFFIGDIHIYTV